MELLTIPKLYKRLGIKIAEETLRRYIRFYGEFFYCEVRNGQKFYSTENIPLIERINALNMPGQRREKVKQILMKEGFPQFAVSAFTEQQNKEQIEKKLDKIIEILQEKT